MRRVRPRLTCCWKQLFSRFRRVFTNACRFFPFGDTAPRDVRMLSCSFAGPLHLKATGFWDLFSSFCTASPWQWRLHPCRSQEWRGRCRPPYLNDRPGLVMAGWRAPRVGFVQGQLATDRLFVDLPRKASPISTRSLTWDTLIWRTPSTHWVFMPTSRIPPVLKVLEWVMLPQ